MIDIERADNTFRRVGVAMTHLLAPCGSCRQEIDVNLVARITRRA
jgi:cytidine deaminase